MINWLLMHTSGAKGNDFNHLRSALMSGNKLIGELSHRRAVGGGGKREVSLLSAAGAQESCQKLRNPVQSTHHFSTKLLWARRGCWDAKGRSCPPHCTNPKGIWNPEVLGPVPQCSTSSGESSQLKWLWLPTERVSAEIPGRAAVAPWPCTDQATKHLPWWWSWLEKLPSKSLFT